MDGDDLNAVVKKAKKQGRTVELLEYVLSQTNPYREPEACERLTAMVRKEKELACGVL